MRPTVKCDVSDLANIMIKEEINKAVMNILKKIKVTQTQGKNMFNKTIFRFYIDEEPK